MKKLIIILLLISCGKARENDDFNGAYSPLVSTMFERPEKMQQSTLRMLSEIVRRIPYTQIKIISDYRNLEDEIWELKEYIEDFNDAENRFLLKDLLRSQHAFGKAVDIIFDDYKGLNRREKFELFTIRRIQLEEILFELGLSLIHISEPTRPY